MSSFKPIIAITPAFEENISGTLIGPNYIAALDFAGAIPMLIPITENHAIIDYYLDLCDGVLMSGGPDVDPALYGEEMLPHCGKLAPCRDKLERYVFDRALALDRPILGICRGCQVMNVLAGGSLYQDLAIDFGTDVVHRMEKPFDREAHLMIPQSGTPLGELLGERMFPVNSIHHQAVKRLADGFDIMAVSEDGVIESIYMPSRRFVWGIQWHPEAFFAKSEDSAKILKAFVAAAADRK